MKVLLVNGSPNKKGSTYECLCEIQKTLKEENIDSEIFWIGNKAIHGCIACLKCRELGHCTFDDAVVQCTDKLDEFDGFIFGSPVYYAGPSGQIISFMDRLFYSVSQSGKNSLYLKPASSVAVARRAGTTATIDVLNKYYALFDMPIISSRYWNVAFAATPDEISEDKEGTQIMRRLARNMAFFLKAKQIAVENGLEFPKLEEVQMTNFTRRD